MYPLLSRERRGKGVVSARLPSAAREVIRGVCHTYIHPRGSPHLCNIVIWWSVEYRKDAVPVVGILVVLVLVLVLVLDVDVVLDVDGHGAFVDTDHDGGSVLEPGLAGGRHSVCGSERKGVVSRIAARRDENEQQRAKEQRARWHAVSQIGASSKLQTPGCSSLWSGV